MSSASNLKKLWLLIFCLLVLIMVSVGGVTRLTRSGLSIVEWKPISGIIPPITEQDWQQQFDLYQKSPEYQHINSHFELSDYKNIFIWEYAHRVLGRLIFLFVVIPGIILWRKKIVSGRLVLGLSLLIALQGLIGWLMVKSGLNTKPMVSPYMLALHFFSALIVLLVGFYHYVKTTPPLLNSITKQNYQFLRATGILLVIQIFYGCLVSGFKAGYGYNTYPLMNGQFFPDEGDFFKPFILNFFENTATIQWTHRWFGILVFLQVIGVIYFISKTESWKALKKPLIHLLGVIVFQIILGILNIIYVIPISLAALHQLVATLLVLSYFSIIFRLPLSNIK